MSGVSKINEGELQQVVQNAKYPSQEVYLRNATKTWDEEGFLYALDRLDTLLREQPKENRDEMRVLYRTLLRENKENTVRLATEVADVARHLEISRNLDMLREPHWSIVPNFWMTVAILILTLLAVIISLLSLHH